MAKRKKETTLTQQVIESKIYTIRGVQVVLDKDLAYFYEVKPIRLREQVKRNANRFPDDFVFQLTEQEVDTLVSQNAIPSKQSLGGHLPYVFNASHDRFLIIDNTDVYHIGASLKDLGKKWFAFSKMDKESLSILEKIKK
ncbi:MAG: ORF6N domain-containing protein [Bacteroidota bacterium]